MIPAKKKEPLVYEAEPAIDSFLGINAFGPHADLKLGELRDAVNLDTYKDYISTRRGSELLIEDTLYDGDILSKISIDVGERELVLVQYVITGDNKSYFGFIELIPGATWKNTRFKENSSLAYTLSTTEPVDMMVSQGVVYVFSTEGNSIFEWSENSELFLRRRMGLPAPQIKSLSGVTYGDLKGKRTYGVELVYKNTQVTPNVDIIVSGPNRAIEVTNPEYEEGRFAVATWEDGFNYRVNVSAILNDGTNITDGDNGIWTHIRLYRSKDETTATNTTPDLQGPAEITGRPDELYLVQEMDKSTFLATWNPATECYNFSDDTVLDDNIPFPRTVTTSERMELIPMPKAKVGAFHRNRVWCSGVEELWTSSTPAQLREIKSKIFFSPEVDTTYSESCQPLSAIESDPGDGQKMTKLISLEEDLIGIKEGKTGRIQYGDPDAGWITEDQRIGILKASRAQFVPGVGICAIVNDQTDFRIFGYDLQWRSTFNGIQVSRPIRPIIKTYLDAQEDLDFFYLNGKLFINGGNSEFLVLAVEQKAGWVKYQYPMTTTEGAFVFSNGTRAAVLNANESVVEIEVENATTDYDTRPASIGNVPLTWSITTHRWQEKNGRSLIEHRYTSIMAKLTEIFSVQPYVNGKIWDVPYFPILDPANYPEATLREVEYQGYAEVKPLGNYIHFEINGQGTTTIYSVMLNCLIQEGSIAPGFDPFQVLSLARRVPSWIQLETQLEETGAAGEEYDETGSALTEVLED